MTVYNIKRTAKIMGIEELIEKIMKWEPKYPPIKTKQGRNNSKWAVIIDLWVTQNYKLKIAA